MEPDVIVLDEPTAGLDPRGRQEIMDMFSSLHKERKLSTVLVTHSMEDASRYADQIVIMHKGTVERRGTPAEIFSNPERLLELGLDVPEVVKLQHKLESAFGTKMDKTCLSMDDLAEEAVKLLKGGKSR